jgi:polyisoprenoid-binding protein YceI
LGNVDQFIESSDFFTLDVADFIGQTADKTDVDSFVQKYKKYVGSLAIEGIEETLNITEDQIAAIADKFLLAVKEAGRIYRHIAGLDGRDRSAADSR